MHECASKNNWWKTVRGVVRFLGKSLREKVRSKMKGGRCIAGAAGRLHAASLQDTLTSFPSSLLALPPLRLLPFGSTSPWSVPLCSVLGAKCQDKAATGEDIVPRPCKYALLSLFLFLFFFLFSFSLSFFSLEGEKWMKRKNLVDVGKFVWLLPLD